jgi:hypothetical protein
MRSAPKILNNMSSVRPVPRRLNEKIVVNAILNYFAVSVLARAWLVRGLGLGTVASAPRCAVGCFYSGFRFLLVSGLSPRAAVSFALGQPREQVNFGHLWSSLVTFGNLKPQSCLGSFETETRAALGSRMIGATL